MKKLHCVTCVTELTDASYSTPVLIDSDPKMISVSAISVIEALNYVAWFDFFQSCKTLKNLKYFSSEC